MLIVVTANAGELFKLSGYLMVSKNSHRECAFEWLVEEAFIYETINKHYQVNDEFEVPKPL